MRSDVEVTILRTPGLMYQKQPDGRISNLYNVQIINKTFQKIPVKLQLKDPAGEIKFVGKELSEVPEQGLVEGEFFVIIPSTEIKTLKTQLTFEIISNQKEVTAVKTNFLGPNN